MAVGYTVSGDQESTSRLAARRRMGFSFCRGTAPPTNGRHPRRHVRARPGTRAPHVRRHRGLVHARRGCRPRALCSSPVRKLRTCSSTTFGCVHPDRFLRLLKPAQPELLVGDFCAFAPTVLQAGVPATRQAVPPNARLRNPFHQSPGGGSTGPPNSGCSMGLAMPAARQARSHARPAAPGGTSASLSGEPRTQLIEPSGSLALAIVRAPVGIMLALAVQLLVMGRAVALVPILVRGRGFRIPLIGRG